MNNTLKAPQSCGTCLGPFSIVLKGHRRMQNRFSLHVSCTTVTYICIFFPGFNAQLLSSWTMITDEIMKKIATEGRMHMEWGENILLWKGNALFGLKDETNTREAFSWAFHTRLSPSQMCKCGFHKMGPCVCPSYPAPEEPPCTSYNMYLCSYLEEEEHKRFFYQVFGREISNYFYYMRRNYIFSQFIFP